MADAVAEDSAVSTLAWRRGRVNANGVELAYEELGPARGEAVLLITGLSWQLIHWPESYCQTLAEKGLRVLRFDNRDAGLSSEVPGKIRISLVKSKLRSKLKLPIKADYSLYHMAEDAVALMTELGIARAHLVGVSMGGMIAQILAACYPQRVLSLTSMMSTTNHPYLPGPSLAVQRYMLSKPADMRRDTIVEHKLQFQNLVASPGFPTPESEQRLLAAQAFDRAYRPGGVLRQTQAIIATGSIEKLLDNVRAPTQIIHGDADTMLPLKCGQRSADCIRDARLEVIPGMGHDLPAQLLSPLAELTLDAIRRV